jgi:WD40 repeat protein
VDWSADGRRIVSASHDRTVRVWDATTGQCVKVLEGHPTLVVSAAWYPDERYIISCDEGAEIRVWDWQGARRESVVAV